MEGRLAFENPNVCLGCLAADWQDLEQFEAESLLSAEPQTEGFALAAHLPARLEAPSPILINLDAD